jgi:DNA replication and repair protein RecF
MRNGTPVAKAASALRRELAGDGAAAPAASARLKRLSLTDFRSYAAAEIVLDGRPAVFFGANGAGKTNILEAVSLIGPGRGLRSAPLGELGRIGGRGGWAVSARLAGEDGERSLGVGADADTPDRRRCRIDGRAATGPGAFADVLRLLWLTPAQDRLFVDGPGERRRFLDRMALARDPAHGAAQADYEHAMRQRQKLLDADARDEAWLGALEARMAEAGVAVAAARRETLSALAAAAVADGAFPAADLALAGEIEVLLARMPAAEVEEAFMARLKSQRRADAEAGRALAGPHRSDLRVVHRANGRPARLCSTGEQKALLVGLVLANARALALAAQVSDAPAPLVLLLDEIAAHLDEARRAALFDIVETLGFHALMTGTDETLFSAWGDRAQGFSVREGRICESRIG